MESIYRQARKKLHGCQGPRLKFCAEPKLQLIWNKYIITRQYIIDAFTDKVFHGNPAAICILEQWPSGELMLNMAVENNLSETAFAVKKGGSYHLRWFTPRWRD